MGAQHDEGPVRWRRLLGSARGWTPLEDGIVVRLPGSGGIRREVRDLVALESVHRPELRWELRDAGPGIITLQVSGAPAADITAFDSLTRSDA